MVGCAASEEESTDTERSAQQTELTDRPDVNGTAEINSCDDLDTYCDSTHTCATGFKCSLDRSHCGANYFGTYPSCGVSATCYPACHPQ